MFNWENTEKIPLPKAALICTLTLKGEFSHLRLLFDCHLETDSLVTYISRIIIDREAFYAVQNL